jgi:hypothetical protein
MAVEGYRFVRALLAEELAEKCDSYRDKHHLSWDALAEKALRKLVDPPKRSRQRRNVNPWG